MSTARGFAAWTIAAALFTGGRFAMAQTGTPPGAPKAAASSASADKRAALEKAWRDGAHRRVEDELTAAFKSDTAWARDTCMALMTGSDTSARPLGAVLLARHARAAELAAMASSLDTVRFPDERRRLVRAVGVRGAAEEDRKPVLATLRPFLRDRDLLVRAAAASAMADLGRPEAVADLAGLVDRIPAYVNSENVDEREIFQRAACGAVRSLTGLRPRSVDEIKRWLADTANGTRVPPRPAPRPAAPPTDVWNGQEFTQAPSFDVYMRIAGMKSAPGDGPLSWTSLTKNAETGAAAARAGLERVAGGPVHEPIPRLYLCDAREFSARAGVTFFQGVTKSNEIVIKLDPPAALAGTMAHEYVHWIHQNLYNDQPRWLSEGLATSFATSVKSSVWKERVPEGDLKKMIERGVFSELFNWNAAGSSDAREASRYALSHVAVDYLRFGEFSVSEERIAFFMGRISRKESPTRALAATYGKDTKAMDRGALEWLAKTGQ